MFDLKTLMSGLVGLLTFILVLFYGKYVWWRRRKMPPGPLPLPIVGNLLQLNTHGLSEGLTKMAKKFGPVYTLYMGPRPTVFLAGYQANKEALVDLGDAFLHRGSLPVFERLFNSKGLTFLNGEDWKQFKQFSLLALKDFGMGKKSFEGLMLMEAEHLVEFFRSSNGKPIDVSATLTCATSNVINLVLVNTRYDYNDEKWMKVLRSTQQAFEVISSPWGLLYDLFPNMMSYLPGPHNKIFSLMKPLEAIVRERIKYHQETLDPACPRDFTDCFLIRMQQENGNLNTVFDYENLFSTVYDMFLGGLETTSITEKFGLLLLLKHPDVQDRLHEEIDRVIGPNREPRAEDRNQMPYMNAVLYEIQRYSDIFPLGIIRSTTRDVTLQGCYIPKGTDVITLLTTVLKDPSQFETPLEFNVHHFLDKDNKFKKNNGFLPFSAGKRACVAESLVRIQLFTFFTVILQKFTLKSQVDPKDLDISPKESGFQHVPRMCKIMFIPRT